MGALIATMILSGRTLQPLGQLSGLLGRLNGANSLQGSFSIYGRNLAGRKTTHFFSRSQILGRLTSKVEFSYPNSEQKVLNNVSLNRTW